jgi:pimeloyl-ACP methyl ester carboxylesterase
VDAPRIRHAQADGASIAYQNFGEGRPAIVMIPPFAHNIELIWGQPEAVEFFERLGTMGRIFHFDKRGCGRSDRRLPPPALEDRITDLRAVMDAEKIERAVIVGISEGGSLATFFAATYPERTEALVLKGAYATFVRTEDHPGLPMARWRSAQTSLGDRSGGVASSTPATWRRRCEGERDSGAGRGSSSGAPWRDPGCGAGRP